MSRQITDLSAAGANLFHAVVELQRLRASSERKFQRWFFETRAEQERAREVQAELQRQLQEERQQRAEAAGSISGARSERLKAEELVKEMRRELQISKEEARRAWEELGRREQEERDRTTSLRNGEPTLVGGVQVVPRPQGVGTRQINPAQRPSTREAPYGGAVGQSPGSTQAQSRRGQPGHDDSPEDPESSYQQPSVSSQGSYEVPAAVSDDQYYTQQRSQQSGRAVTYVPSPSRGYGQSTSRGESRIYPQGSADTAIRQGSANGQSSTTPVTTNMPEERSYEPSAHEPEGYAEEDYEINPDGSIRRDSQGRPIRYRSPRSAGSSEEYEQREYGQSYQPTSRPSASTSPQGPSAYDPYTTVTTSQPTSQPPSSRPVDYSGQDWGQPSSTGWESITPRHRHPTRLSDVVEEEDERSRRTSPSRGSGVSGGERGAR